MPHFVAAICRSRAATSIKADWPSGNAPTTRVRRRTSSTHSLQGVIGADLPPADQGRGRPQRQGSQLRDDRLRRGRGRLPILLGVDRLQHTGDDVELPARDVAEDVPIPVDHTPLPPGLGVALRGGFHQADTGIADDQLHPFQPAGLQVSEETPPAVKVLLLAFGHAQDVVLSS